MSTTTSASADPEVAESPKATGAQPANGTARVRVVKLIYQTYLPFQGRYPRVSGQAKILQDHGYDVTVLACDREGHGAPQEELVEGIQVKRIRVKTGEHRGPMRQLWPLLVFCYKSLRWLLRQRFDILHCHNIDVLPLGYLVGRLKPCAVVFEAHEPDYYALWPKRWKPMLRIVKAVERFLVRRIDAISVTNSFQVEKYQELGVRRVQLIGNYPLPHLRIAAVPEEKFRRPHVVFGRLGTVYRDTGFEAAIAAFQRVLEDHPETEFLIAGRVADNYREDFYQLIDPLRQHIRLTEAFSAGEMPGLYHQLDASLLVYPRSDWFRNITPRKFFDSMANGVPVIMTDIGRLGAVIREHECGFVVDETDLDSITAAMTRMIEDVVLRRQMAENSLRLASTEFDWSRMAGEYISLQQDLLTESQGR